MKFTCNNRIAPQRKDCNCPCHLPGNFPGCATCGMVQCCYPNELDPVKSEAWTRAFLDQLRADYEEPPPPPSLKERLEQYKFRKSQNNNADIA